MRGTGQADVFVMLAHPVGHAKSPGIFNAIFEARGLDSLMTPLSCRPEDFDVFWAGLSAAENVRGVIVSVPFKARALEKAAVALPRAARTGAANALRRLPGGGWEADNFDGAGFMGALAAGGHEVAGRRVLQLGAGGAGASLAFGLAEAGAAAIRISDPDGPRAEALALRAQAAFPGCAFGVGPAAAGEVFDMAVNATPLGMKPDDPLPVPADLLRPGMLVVDIVMEPAETRLLAEARARGCAVQPGRPMMDHQVEAIAAFFDIARERRHG